MHQCACMSPRCRHDAYDETDVGRDETNGRFGDVTILRCKHCGNIWLKYQVEYEAFTKSGRWFLGLISDETSKLITAENAIAALDSLDWRFMGGSYFESAGFKTEDKTMPDLFMSSKSKSN
jgi:hypothetical protein